jgi:DNA (cytosine-5)-methyltransferase 1
MTRNGVASERPTWEHRTGDTASSSLLGTPRTSSSNGVGQYTESERGTRGRLEAQVDLLLRTPTAQLAVNGGSQHPDKRKAGGHGPTLADEIEHLLPTPRASDTGTPGRRASEGWRPPLSQVLLPTPRATDGTKGGPNQRGSSGDLMLPSAVQALINGVDTPQRSTDGN